MSDNNKSNTNMKNNSKNVTVSAEEYAALLALEPIAKMFIESHGFNTLDETLKGLTFERLSKNYAMSQIETGKISQAADALVKLSESRQK